MFFIVVTTRYRLIAYTISSTETCDHAKKKNLAAKQIQTKNAIAHNAQLIMSMKLRSKIYFQAEAGGKVEEEKRFRFTVGASSDKTFSVRLTFGVPCRGRLSLM